MFKTKRNSLFFLALLMHCVSAQNFLVKNYTKQNGLLHGQIFDITQDKNAFVWLATGGGITRFDGSEFLSYSIRDSLPSAEFYDFYLDETDKLWLAGNGGIAFINLDKPNNLDIELLDSSENNFGVFSILTNKKDVLLGTRQNGLQIFSKNKYFTHPISTDQDKGILKGLKKDQNGNIWACFINHSLFSLDSTYRIINEYKGVEFSEIKQFSISDSNDIYFITTNKLYHLDTKTSETHLIKDFTLKEKSIELYNVAYKNQTLVISSNYGVFVREKNKQLFLNKKNGLSTNYISVSFIDQHNNIWIGSDSYGLDLLHSRNIRLYTENSGLRNSTINSLVLSNNRILIASDQGIQYLDNDGKVQNDERFGALDKKTIWAMQIVADEIYIGTDEFVYLYSNSSNKISKIDGLPISTYVNFMDLGGGEVLICSMNGLFLYNGKSVKTFDYINDLVGSNVWIAKKWNDQVLLGTQRGIFSYNVKKSEINVLTDKHQNVYSIAGLTDTNFYFGNDFGLFKYSNDSISEVFASKGQSFGVISTIKKNTEESLWVAHQYGIDLFDGKNIIQSYDSRKGSLVAEVTTETAYLKHENRNYFGLFQGLLVIDDNNQQQKDAPSVVITKKEFRNETGERINKQDSDLTFGHQINSVEFEFTSPWFLNSQSISYQYFLEGFDKKWSQPSKLRSVYYSGLAAGNYQFKVKAISSTSVESIVKTYNFNILAPFWKKKSFYLLSILAIVLISYISIRQYVRITKKRSSELERSIRMRTKDLLQAKEDIERIVDFAAISILTIDTNGIVVYINKQFENLFEINKDDYIGQNISKLDTENDSESFLEIVESVSTNHEFTEAQKLSKTFKSLPLFISINKLYDSNNKQTGYTLAINDLSEQYELQEKRDEQQKLLTSIQVMNRLLGTMSHYINNSVAAILNSIELHENTGEFKDEMMKFTSEHAKRIENVIKSLAALVKNLNLKTKKYSNGSTDLFDIENDLTVFDEHLIILNEIKNDEMRKKY